jgi:hypothetical protein
MTVQEKTIQHLEQFIKDYNTIVETDFIFPMEFTGEQNGQKDWIAKDQILKAKHESTIKSAIEVQKGISIMLKELREFHSKLD